MALLWSRRVVAALLLLVVLAQASVVPHFSHADEASLFSRQDQDLDSPLCRPTCDSGTCGNGGSCSLLSFRKREWADALHLNGSDEDTHQLGKRIFSFQAGGRGPFGGRGPVTFDDCNKYISWVANKGDAYYGNALPTVALGGPSGVLDERAYSQQVRIHKNSKPFQIISTGVHGCTVIVVASKRAVWMAHLWESYSNGKDEQGNNLVGRGDPAFGQRVLSFLKGEGVNNPLPNGYPAPFVQPNTPRIDATLYSNERSDQTQVFVFTPVKYGVGPQSMGNPNNLKYYERYGPSSEVKDTIQGIFNGARPRYQVIPYIPLNTLDPGDRAEQGTNARGTVLFQFDNNHDGNGQFAWRLFMETRVIYQVIENPQDE